MGNMFSFHRAPEKESREGRFIQPRSAALEHTEPPEEDIKDILQVTDVNFNIRDECKAHHTDKYSLTEERPGQEQFLVVRRGQPFQMRLTCDQSYDKQRHELELIFETGRNPLVTKGTRVEMILSEVDPYNQWGAKILEQSEDKSLTLEVITPPSCLIGRWSLKIRTLKKENMQPSHKIYSHPRPIYVLFNPWCTEDQVYLHDNGLLEEYVLNDSGKIFVGSSRSIYGRPWSFGQFEDPILDCVLDLLDNNNFPAPSRGDPIKIVRKLTALVNSSDDYGILMGNWSGNYEGGSSPTFWTGSQAILEKYYNTKSPVKYGQCWVFSGVLTTCNRVLGIPCRSVTNFSSAHDTDLSVSIDYHFDEEGDRLEHMDTDSIWNFHVWNDVWMARPDLKNEEDKKNHRYGGWQACDATPQEESDGIYRCGPCPLMAIKNGNVNVPFDGRFIFAEVNADIVHWQMLKNGKRKKLTLQTERVGQYISTHKPKCEGDNNSWSSRCRDKRWEDITSEYKYKEGWAAERAAVLTANMYGTRAGFYNQPVEASEDVTVKVVDKEECNYGDDIVVEIEFENLSKEERNISGTWSLASYYSTGVYAKKIRADHLDVKLGSQEKKTQKMQIKFEEYNPNTIEGCFFKTAFVCIVEETRQTAMDDDDFRLIKPDLHLKVPKEVTVGTPFKVIFSFNNPLPVTLTQCSLAVEGPGVMKRQVIKQSNVGANQTFNYDMMMTASKPGTRTIIASFDSKEIVAINGSYEMEVKDN